jgi:polar amino acid transport system substrate-binding protein
MITALQEGKIDAVIASMAPTPEREEKVDFTTEYYVGTQTFLGAADTEITIEDPTEDLVGYKIGVQSATTLEEWVVENLVETGQIPDGDVLRYERADNAALDLQAGRLEVVFLDSGPAFELADEMGLTELYTANVVETQGAAIAVPTGEDELRSEMNSIIEDLKEEGYIDQLIEEWLY